MRTADRRREVLDLVRRGHGSVDELCARFDVSVATIRRDLAALARDGEITRTYGGAAAGSLFAERSLTQRAAIARDEKTRIARAALGMLRSGDTLFLDAGTTAGAIAEEIGRGTAAPRPLTVITHGLTAVNALADVDSIELIILGGTLRKISQGMLGPLTESALTHFTADYAFLSADAVTADLGLGETTLVQARLKEQVIARAENLVVVADASKLGSRRAKFWAAMPRRYTLVTDSSATPEQCAPFRANPDVEVRRV